MHTSTLISSDLNRAIMLRSFHQRNAKRSKHPQGQTRKEAEWNTKSYKDGLQRAFNKAKEQIYFNPDMKYFITLTYKKNDNTIEEVLKDVKQLIKYESRHRSSLPAGSGPKKLKYIFIMEYQKRGSIHVHMISNSFTTYRNKNGYQSLKYWTKGYSSVLHITDFDNNFRPYLYLFKYMKKAQRIGKSFVHSSRNLTNYTKLEDASINIENWNTKNMEYSHTTVETTNFHYFKNYLEFNDTIKTQTINKELITWHEKVKLHSMKELGKLLANHSQHSN